MDASPTERQSTGTVSLLDDGPQRSSGELANGQGSGDLANGQQLVYYVTAVSSDVRSRHKDNFRCSAVEEQLKQKKSNFLNPAPPPCS